MRKKITIVSFLILFMYAGVCYAAPNHFLPATTSQEVLTVSADQGGLQSGWYFGVFDWGESMSKGLLLLSGGSVVSAQFKVEKKQDGSGYQISVIEGVDKGETLDIGNSEDFSFFFYDGSSYYEPANIYENSFVGNSYYFSYNSQTVQGNDISAVPNPQSFILLLSGLLGLIGLSRREE